MLPTLRSCDSPSKREPSTDIPGDIYVETSLYDFVYPNQITDLFIRSGYLLFVRIIWTDLFHHSNMASQSSNPSSPSVCLAALQLEQCLAELGVPVGIHPDSFLLSGGRMHKDTVGALSKPLPTQPVTHPRQKGLAAGIPVRQAVSSHNSQFGKIPQSSHLPYIP